MTETKTHAPVWDLTTIYPSVSSPEFKDAVREFRNGLSSLTDRFDALTIRAGAPTASIRSSKETLEEVLTLLNAIIAHYYKISTYVGCITSADATNEEARSIESELSMAGIGLSLLRTRFTGWIGDQDILSLCEVSQIARDHEFFLERSAYFAKHQMSEKEETLATELATSSISSWARLHGEMTAKLSVTVPYPTGAEILPISELRTRATHPDREIRRVSFEAELGAWESVSVPLAAAINGVKGYQQTLRKHRGYASDVEPSYRYNSIDEATLTAMQTACEESFSDLRRYYRAKAKLIGVDSCEWYDIEAPVVKDAKFWKWPDATEFLLNQFGGFSPRMRDLAARAFNERWVDAPPRFGKEGGAYCAHIGNGDSRILMNYDGSYGNVSTLAHELGHAYHNLCLKDRLPLQKSTPSTLAETASIFCETIALEAALSVADEQEKLHLLDSTLERDTAVIIDIHSRFLFEKGLFERRSSRDASISELKELMISAQDATYGDAVTSRHPYMWSVKSHYYGPLFYNYPYTFGLLFGLGLYEQFRKDPERFVPAYDEFLSRTGLADAHTLAEAFGIDITGLEFWRSSLRTVKSNVIEFERLAGRANQTS